MGASSRIRTYQYRMFLESRGIEMKISPLLDRGYLENLYERRQHDVRAVMRGIYHRIQELRSMKGYDLAWVEKELFPWFPVAMEKVFRPPIPFILDYDDAVFHKYDIHPYWMIRKSLGKKIDSIMRAAAKVVVGNEYLAQRARDAGARRVEILPSVVDLSKYPGVLKKEREGIFTIGWIGSPSTAKHLMNAEPALKAVCCNGGGKIELIGIRENPFSDLEAKIFEWEGDREVERIGNIDVGIMPLPDNPWERGKCGFKLIQYMACGKPVVASPVGMNREIVIHGLNGFLASTQEEWVDALERLRSSRTLRETMGANGRQLVEERFNLDITAPRLLEILVEAAGKG